MYDNLRATLIHSHDLDGLCAVINAVKGELIEDLQLRDPGLNSMLRLVTHLQQDVQERLVFLSQKYIRDHIVMFVPAAANLDYPNVLSTPPKGSRKIVAILNGQKKETKVMFLLLARSTMNYGMQLFKLLYYFFPSCISQWR